MMRRVVFLLVIAGLLLSYHLNKPFIGHHDWNGVFWGRMAREYLRGHFTYFSHYTPLLPIVLSLSGFIFGIHEWSLRLVTVCFSLAMIFAIYRIGEMLYGKRAGLLAVALAMATPMLLYFGKLPDHEPIVTSLITIVFYFYLRLGEKAKNIRLYFFSALLLAFLESWASYFLIPFLFVHAMLFEKKRIAIVLQGAMIGILVVVFHITSIFVFNGPEGFTNFLHAGTFRLNLDISSKNLSQFTWPQFAETEARYSVIYFTRILLGLAGVWAVRVIARSLRRGNLMEGRLPRSLHSLAMTFDSSDATLLVLFFTGASFIVVFSNLSYIHDYKLYLLLPFIALTSGETLCALITAIEKRTKNMQLGNIVVAMVVLFAIVFTATEREQYLRTLLDTSFNSPGYKLGQLINQKTVPDEKVLVDSLEFGSFYEVFVNYYADRPVLFGDMTLAAFQENEKLSQQYRYIILVDKRPVDQELQQYLLQTYESEKIGDFTFVDLQKQQKNYALVR